MRTFVGLMFFAEPDKEPIIIIVRGVPSHACGDILKTTFFPKRKQTFYEATALKQFELHLLEITST
jgi:hypothetical protein